VAGGWGGGNFAYHPRLVSTRHRRPALVALILALALSGTACDGDDAPANPNGGQPPTPDNEQPSSVGKNPGQYEYRNAGLVVSVSLKGNQGTMSIENGTDHPLDKPDLYILDAADGHQVDGKVLAPEPTPAGETKEFEVQFPPSVDPLSNIGLLMLLIGTDNYGAFVPL